MHDDGRHVILLVSGDPRHQHDMAWGWAEALMMIRSGTLRRSDPGQGWQHYTEPPDHDGRKGSVMMALDHRVNSRADD